jgi:hypothetical protein
VKERIGMDYVSSWWTPIEVRLGRARAITYGVVATELVEASIPSSGFPGELINRFGIPNLRRAAHVLSDLPSDESTPDSTLANRLAEFVANEFAPLVASILDAADASGRLDAPVSRGVRRLIDVYGPKGLHPVRLSRDGKTTWGHRHDTLIERAAVEIFELHASHARLRRCIYCNSVYVPRRDERYCQWNIWPTLRTLEDPPLRLCSPERHKAIRERSTEPADVLVAHTRERKRLSARVDRARAAALQRGEDPDEALSVIKAIQARKAFLSQSDVRRGRDGAEPAEPDIAPAD